ncbi:MULTISPECIES: hypothetical protein [unclassified Microcoleus]|uniref:hypothetical protein n=1 Tax=unclassified Microcoleus TaxID=2642155 RepID=UPI001DDA910F|nr:MULTISPECIES: hypothetical protein [unclassified Microcoleus]MCC3582127.1 hypothetical protein [Microcoleus sp. PH2017_32_RDM_D_A]MCC3620010.1 hypothetical protein [Microcoleus sp. PH2017_38_RDM_U_B]
MFPLLCTIKSDRPSLPSHKVTPVNFNGATTDQNGSFIYFVYPFLFETANFQTLKNAISQTQIPARQNQMLWESQTFPKDDLLFHVANYLNPTDNHPPTASLWKLNEAARDILGFRAQWELITPIAKIPFNFGEAGEGNKAVQLALFQIGVGFLTIRTQPDSNNINQWLNFLHYFRFLEGQQGTHIKAQRRIGLNPDTKQPQFEPFFPEIAGGNAQYQAGKNQVHFGQIVTALLKKSALPPTELPEPTSKQWWSEVFIPGQMLPFTALFADNLPPDETQLLLYKLQNLFHEKQGNYPAPEDLEPNNPAWLPYASRQWFIFSLEGGSFLAADAPKTDFFRKTLPSHLRDQYFLLFLIALHQRFTLMMLSSKVALNWLSDSDKDTNSQREHVFEEIRNQLLVFTARGYFAQVMQRQHHHRCYRQWHEVFQIQELYQEVNDEVRDMYEYSLMQQTRRLETTIQVIGVAVGTGGIIASSIANYIQQPLSLKPTWKIDTIHPAVLVLLLSVSVGVAAGVVTWLSTGGWHWILKRIQKRDKN